MKKVSVVILNWNGQKLLEKFLPLLLLHTDSDLADIVIADNNSSDNSLSYLSQNYASIKTIKLDVNLGFAEGYNTALKQLKTPYFVLMNSDVEVTRNWLEPLIQSLEKGNKIAAVQPKILSEKNKNYYEYAGASGGYIDIYGYPFCRGRIFDAIEKDEGQYNNAVDVFWASGACLAIKSAIYFEVGGFDKTFFAHMEEIDLCWRLNARGYRLVCNPTSTVFHVGGATLSTDNPKKTFLNFRNNLLMLYKNLKEDEFERIYRVRKFLDYLAAFKMLVTRKKSSSRAIIKAHQEFKKIKVQYSETRDYNISKTVNTKIFTIYSGNILFQYFVKRCRKFSKLNWTQKS